MITREAMDVLLHTLGLSEGPREPYRNLFVAGEGHEDWHSLLALEAAGLMVRLRRPGFLEEGDVPFRATEQGKRDAMAEAHRRVPKLTRSQRRYREWLARDSGQSFGEFLRGRHRGEEACW